MGYFDPTDFFGSLYGHNPSQNGASGAAGVNMPLMGLAQGLLQASGPSRMPVGFGQGLGMGLQGFQKGQEDEQAQTLKKLMLQVQMQKLQRDPIADKVNMERALYTDPQIMDAKLKLAAAGAAQTPTAVYDPSTNQLRFVGKNDAMNFQPPGAAPNDTEKTAGGFAERMLEQEARMKQLSAQGETGAGLGANVAESLPLVGNFMQTPQFQQVRQAQNDWIRAKLRKESGAVISPKEMDDERKTYFPMPGDGPDVISQKDAARETAVKSMQQSAGNAYRSQGARDAFATPPDGGQTPNPVSNSKTINGKTYIQQGGKWYEQ